MLWERPIGEARLNLQLRRAQLEYEQAKIFAKIAREAAKEMPADLERGYEAAEGGERLVRAELWGSDLAAACAGGWPSATRGSDRA